MPAASALPRIDFTTFILSVSSAAFMGLGITPPGTGQKPEIDLELARQNIDLLELIAEKTKGNLDAEEARLLEQLLFETRMRFVETLQKNPQGAPTPTPAPAPGK